MFFCLPILTTCCICFCVLGRLFPSPGIVTLCSGCLVGLIHYYSLSDHLSKVSPECPLCGFVSLPNTWVLIAVGLFVGGIHPQIGWLWSTLTTFYCFCAGPDPGSRTHSSRFWHLLRSPFGCVACVTTWVILWHDLEPATWVCLFWGLLRGTPMQVKVRSGLSLALGHLFGAAVWSTVRAAYLWPGCLWEGPSCLPLELSLELSLELVTKRPKTPQDLSPLLSAC